MNFRFEGEAFTKTVYWKDDVKCTVSTQSCSYRALLLSMSFEGYILGDTIIKDCTINNIKYKYGDIIYD